MKEKKIFYGWWIASACTIVNFLLGLFFYGFTAFFTPMREEFGWSSAETSFGFSLRSMEGGIFSPVLGFFVDKIGTRKMMIAGISIMSISLMLFSRIHSLLGFYTVFILLSIGFSACGSLVSITAVANWFNKKRGRALGFMTTGYTIGGMLVPLLVFLITVYGWRTTFMILGIGLLIIGIPSAFVIKDRPEDYGYLPDGDTEIQEKDDKSDGFTVGEAIKTRAFWLITLSYTLRYVGTSAFLVLAIPYLESIGFSAKVSALVVTGVSLSGFGGRIVFGWLGDLFDKRHILAILLGIQSISMILCAYLQDISLLIPFVIAYGLGYGGTIPLRGAIQGDYFGRRAFASLQGVILGVMILGMVIGPTIAGLIYDLQGSYQSAWLIYAAITLFTVPMILAAKKPKQAVI